MSELHPLQPKLGFADRLRYGTPIQAAPLILSLQLKDAYLDSEGVPSSKEKSHNHCWENSDGDLGLPSVRSYCYSFTVLVGVPFIAWGGIELGKDKSNNALGAGLMLGGLALSAGLTTWLAVWENNHCYD